MKNNKNKIVGLIVALLVFFGFATDNINLGGVQQGSEYNATTSISTSAGTHWLAKGIASGGTCALGSVVIASTSVTTLTLWDATSTTDIASTTIVTFKENVVEGTYVYDIVCFRGLIVETPSSFDGIYTITYR